MHTGMRSRGWWGSVLTTTRSSTPLRQKNWMLTSEGGSPTCSPPASMGSVWMCLGVHMDADLQCNSSTSGIVKKVQQHLHFEDPQENQPKEGTVDFILLLLHIASLCGSRAALWHTEKQFKGSLTPPKNLLAILFPPHRTSTAPAVSRGHAAFFRTAHILDSGGFSCSPPTGDMGSWGLWPADLETTFAIRQ